MGSVTPTVVPGEGYVRVEVNWQDVLHNRRVWISRVVNGLKTRLRDGDYAWLSNGIAVAFDHEAPLDTVLSYESTIPLNYNGDFETGVTEWQDTTNTGTTGTVTQSLDYYVPGTGNASARIEPVSGTSRAVSELVPITADAVNVNPYFEVNATDWSGINSAGVSRDTVNFHQGVASLLVTPNGVASTPGALSGEYPVVVGQTYGYSAWLRISSGGTASRDVGISWYTAAHAFISNSVQTLSPAATVWQFYSGTAVAPATAAFARLITQGPGVLAAANTWRVDQFVLTDPTTQVQYTLSGQLLVPDYYASGIGISLQWYSDTTTLISTSGGFTDTAPFPGVWTPYTLTAASPPGANGVRISFGSASNSVGGTPVYGDEMYLTRPGTTVASGPVVVPSSGGGWWADPLHPATKVRLQVELEMRSDCLPPAGVAYLGVGEETFPADSVSLEVNDAVLPVAAFQRRKSGRQEIRVGTATLADMARVKALHAPGAPLLLQINAAYGEADAYQLHGDLVVPRLNGDQRVPWRLASSQFVKVAPSIGPAEGTLKTRYVDLTKYTAFWQVESANGGVWDDFQRVVSNGAGTATSGQVWTVDGTASWVSVNGSSLILAPAALNTRVGVRLAAVNLTDFELRTINPVVPASVGDYIRSEVIFRYVDSLNYYLLRVHRQVSNAIDLQLIRVNAGAESTITAVTSTVVNVPGTGLNLWIRAVGTALAAKIWRDGTSEPTAAEITGTAATAPAGQVGLGALLPPANTNTLPVPVGFDNLTVIKLDAGGAPTWLDALRGNLAA